MEWELVGEVTGTEIVAAGRAIREISRLRKVHGGGRWRKLEGIATVRFPDGTVCRAEVHWYEAHGIGKREMKLERILD